MPTHSLYKNIKNHNFIVDKSALVSVVFRTLNYINLSFLEWLFKA